MPATMAGGMAVLRGDRQQRSPDNQRDERRSLRHGVPPVSTPTEMAQWCGTGWVPSDGRSRQFIDRTRHEAGRQRRAHLEHAGERRPCLRGDDGSSRVRGERTARPGRTARSRAATIRTRGFRAKRWARWSRPRSVSASRQTWRSSSRESRRRAPTRCSTIWSSHRTQSPQACVQLARYLRLIGNPANIEILEDRDRVRIQIGDGAAPFSIEYLASLMVIHLKAETDGRFAAAAIHFRHTPDDVVAFDRILDCEVRPGASWNGLVVPLESWRLPLRRRDPVLRHVLEAHADDILARLPKRAGLALDVQRALASRVADGNATIDGIARQLAMSGRTLQTTARGRGRLVPAVARRRAQGSGDAIHLRAIAVDL